MLLLGSRCEHFDNSSANFELVGKAGTVPELPFEKKGLSSALQQMLIYKCRTMLVEKWTENPHEDPRSDLNPTNHM